MNWIWFFLTGCGFNFKLVLRCFFKAQWFRIRISIFQTIHALIILLETDDFFIKLWRWFFNLKIIDLTRLSRIRLNSWAIIPRLQGLVIDSHSLTFHFWFLSFTSRIILRFIISYLKSWNHKLRSPCTNDHFVTILKKDKEQFEKGYLHVFNGLSVMVCWSLNCWNVGIHFRIFDWLDYLCVLRSGNDEFIIWA